MGRKQPLPVQVIHGEGVEIASDHPLLEQNALVGRELESNLQMAIGSVGNHPTAFELLELPKSRICSELFRFGTIGTAEHPQGEN